MRLRRLVSMTALVSFLGLILTSVIMYIVPAGRVAYWVDWRLWGLTKEEWGALHINLGVLFLVSSVFHIYYNWGAIVTYIKSKMKSGKGARGIETWAALAITVLVCVMTLMAIPPASWVIHGSESIKDQAAIDYGEPPYGHAELSSLKMFADKMNLDLERSMAILGENGIEVQSPSETVGDIAMQAGVSPKVLYEMLQKGGAEKAQESVETVGTMPSEPPTGTGRLPLLTLCESYSIPLGEAAEVLKAAGYEANGKMTLMEIAQSKGGHPHEVYLVIQEHFFPVK